MSQTASSQSAEPPAKPARRRRRGCGCGTVLLVLIALLCAAGGYGYWLWSTEPAYVAREREKLVGHTPEALEAMADRLENRISRELTALTAGPDRKPRRDPAAADANETTTGFEDLQALAEAPGEKTLRLPTVEVNAWIRTKAPAWLSNQGAGLPPQVSEPTVGVESGRPVIGFRFTEGGFSQWVSLALDVSVSETGEAGVRVAGVRGGRLPMPVHEMLDRFEKRAETRDARARVQRVRSAVEGQTFDAKFKLDGKRIATVTGFTAEPDGLTLTVRTEPITPDNAEAAEDLPSL